MANSLSPEKPLPRIVSLTCCSSIGLERRPAEAEVAGSSPASKIVRRDGGIGRRAALRTQWATVQVRVLFPVPNFLIFSLTT